MQILVVGVGLLYFLSHDIKKHDSIFLSLFFSYLNGTYFLVLHLYKIRVSSPLFVVSHYLSLYGLRSVPMTSYSGKGLFNPTSSRKCSEKAKH